MLKMSGTNTEITDFSLKFCFIIKTLYKNNIVTAGVEVRKWGISD